MGIIKKYVDFLSEEAQPMPAQPKTKPRTKPGVNPGVKPNRQRPSPIRRDKPGVEPAPKAKSPKATEEEVVERFVSLMDERGEDIKKYITE